MTKIAMLGAGSVVFMRRLMNDILSVPELQDSTFHLMDIDPERLSLAERLAKKLIKDEKLPATIKATTSQREAIKDSNFVVIVIQVGGLDAYRLDYEIPMKYGVDQCVGDTLCPGGIFRGLRTFPALISMAKDVEETCPEDAIILNYSNPMAMNTWAVFKSSKANFVGLCHGVQHTAEMLASHIGADMKDIDYWCAGINHMAWFLEYRWKGRDAYPLIRKFAEESPDKIAEGNEKLRYHMFKNFGYFMTESSGHLSEYIPWYRKGDIMKEFEGSGKRDFTGKTREYLTMCEEALKHYLEEINKMISSEEPSKLLPRSTEYCSYIIEAKVTGRITRINGNVRNTGLITNMQEDSCVEVPCFVDRLGIHPCYVGDLPPQCAALCRSNSSVQELAVIGGLEGDKEMVFQAVLQDPLTAAVCSIDEVHSMVDELFEAEAEWLPQFS